MASRYGADVLFFMKKGTFCYPDGYFYESHGMIGAAKKTVASVFKSLRPAFLIHARTRKKESPALPGAARYDATMMD
jgi:hypothetical protein